MSDDDCGTFRYHNRDPHTGVCANCGEIVAPIAPPNTPMDGVPVTRYIDRAYDDLRVHVYSYRDNPPPDVHGESGIWHSKAAAEKVQTFIQGIRVVEADYTPAELQIAVRNLLAELDA